jgi:hypothetical protein
VRSYLLLFAALCSLWLAFYARAVLGRSPESDAAAALALRQAPLPPQAPSCEVKPHLPGKNCKCGCVETGRCVCKDCDHPKGADPRPPNPNCQCGCTETGRCDCKDCDHPRITPKQGEQSRRPDGGWCSGQCRCGCNEGVPCQCGTARRAEPYPIACPHDGTEMRYVVSWDGRWLECPQCRYTVMLSGSAPASIPVQPHVHPVGPPVGYMPQSVPYAMPMAFPTVSCGRGG